MRVAPVDATTISVLDTLHKLDTDFSAMAAAFENGEFALWVGSGIAKKAPSLGNLVARAVEFLRRRTPEAATNGAFQPALQRVLRLAGVNIAEVNTLLGQPFSEWPQHAQI